MSLDAPPAPANSADEAPPQDGWAGGLPVLRAELDRIDDALHTLLMQRASVVEQVAKSGKRGAYRPGREASIIRRLLRQHRGALPAQAIVRIWRELLAGTTAMQGSFAIAVCAPEGETALTQVAREHFGVLTSLHVYRDASQALAAVRGDAASVAVLPIPSATTMSSSTWWTALLQADEPRLHVVARLPFWTPRPDGVAAAQALVVAAVEPDSSGRDRSLLGMELASDVTSARLAAALADAGFQPGMLVLSHDRGAPVTFAIAEIDGFLTEDDRRLSRLDAVRRRPVVIGAYAIPETGDAA